MRKRTTCLCMMIFIVFVLLAACGVPASPEVVAGSSQGTSEELALRNSMGNALSYLDDQFYMQDGFTSQFPLLVIRENEVVDFYVEEDAYSLETLSRPSALRASATELWSEEEQPNKPKREKRDYFLYFSAEDLAGLGDQLWDAEVSGEWFLLGNMYDKSLMRNYLALTIAQELGNASYLVQYCEVFMEAAGGLEYRGVYLIAAPPVTGYYHFQRGNYWDTTAAPLDTYATQNEILVEQLYVPDIYALDAGQHAQLEDSISRAEQSIFSGDYNEFSKYSNYMDSQKMYDYFILYELFGNYAGGHLAHYVYDPQQNDFWPVALPDFEFSVDNEQKEPLDRFSIEMMDTAYYTALVKDTNFIKGMIDRYRSLYQDVLKSSNIDNRVEETATLLGEAQPRDWARWETMYDGEAMYALYAEDENPTDPALPPLNRNTYSYEQEINKLKLSLREHGQYMFAGMATLYDQEDMIGDDAPYIKNTWMFAVALAIVIIAVRIVRYRTR